MTPMKMIENPGRRYLGALISLAALPAALAYIDPGTGGLVLGSTWGLLASALGAVGAFVLFRLIKPLKNRIKDLIRRQ